jgi:Large polyvalent protein associated domain 38
MYRADGGKTGFLDLQDLESRQKQLVSDFRNAQASPSDPRTYHRLAMRYMKSAEDFIMDINSGIENAARVAAYKAYIENAGYNYTNAPASIRNEAATVAKNLTVNFNRRGKWTPFISSFYLFFNPAVQSAVRTGKLVMSPRGAAVAGSLVALGYLAASMSDGAAGEDGEEYWNKEANKTAKLRNLLFFGPNGEQYNVPLPYGLGFFVNLGYVFRDLENGVSPLKAASFLKDSFFTHFSPLGAMDNIANFLAPTLMDPLLVLRSEKRESGVPLLPMDYSGSTPDSQRYWTSSRDTLLQRFTTWMDEATAGNVSVSPERLGYLLSFATGGGGAFVRDLVKSDLTTNVGPDAALDDNAYPFLKQFYKRDTGRADRQAFFENVKTVTEARKILERIESGSGMKHELERVNTLDAYAALETFRRRAMHDLSELRKEEIEVIDNPSLTPAQKYERRKQIDADRRLVELEFNKDFYGTRRSVEPNN